MSTRLAFVLGISLLSAAALARTQEQKTGEFSSVHVAAGIHAQVEVAGETSVRIDADDEVMPFVDVHVEGSELYVGFKRHSSFHGEHTVKATIRTPQLKSVSGSGGSEVRATFSRGNDVEVQASGGSHLHVGGVDAARLRLSGSGGSVLDVSGSADTLDLQLSGGSQLHGRDLSVKDVSVQASGGSQGDLRADGRIRGSLSGGSELHVRGHASSRVATSGGSELSVDD
jgi:putative autotransporter adhesin-like protein